MVARGEPHDGVVAGHLLPGAHRAQLDHVLLDRQGDGKLAAGLRAVHAAEGARRQEEPELPERLAAAEPEAIGHPDGDQVLRRLDPEGDPPH